MKTIARTFLLILTALCFTISAAAATFVVNTTNDTQDVSAGDGVCADSGGNCSFRAAISESNALAGDDTITLPAGTYTQSLVAAPDEIDNAGGDWNIRANVTINGAGAANTILQAAATPEAATDRVLRFIFGNTYTLSGVTVRNGKKEGTRWLQDVGGGIQNSAFSTLTVNNSIITHRAAVSFQAAL